MIWHDKVDVPQVAEPVIVDCGKSNCFRKEFQSESEYEAYCRRADVKKWAYEPTAYEIVALFEKANDLFDKYLKAVDGLKKLRSMADPGDCDGKYYYDVADTTLRDIGEQ